MNMFFFATALFAFLSTPTLSSYAGITLVEPKNEVICVDELSDDEITYVESLVAVNNCELQQGQSQRIYYEINDNGDVVVLPQELQDWVYEMCYEYNIAGYEKMIIAKLYCESGFNEKAICKNANGTKDYGLAQINSSNHSRLKNTLGITDFLDPQQSIRAGVYMMSECLEKNNYDESMALAAYNTGRNGLSETKYTKRVLKIKDNSSIHEF